MKKEIERIMRIRALMSLNEKIDRHAAKVVEQPDTNDDATRLIKAQYTDIPYNPKKADDVYRKAKKI